MTFSAYLPDSNMRPTAVRRPHLLAGTLIAGLTASAPFAFIYLVRPQEAVWWHMVIVFGSLFVGGAAYGLLAGSVLGRPVGVRVAAGVGISLLLAAVVAIVVGFGAEGGLGGLPLPTVYALVIPPIVAAVAFIYALVLGRALGVPEASWRPALACGLVAGAVVLVLALATDPLPGWRVGTGNAAMVKVAWLGTLLGGAAAGAIYLTLLGRAYQQ